MIEAGATTPRALQPLEHWEQSGEKVYVVNEFGEPLARVCIATNMDRAAEIVRLRSDCVDGLCRRARREFVRGAFAAMVALSAGDVSAAEACRVLGVTEAEIQEVADQQ